MPSPREFTLAALYFSMELLAGFAVLVGSTILHEAPLHYASFWLLAGCGLCGIAAAAAVGVVLSDAPWDRIALVTVALLIAGVPSYLFSGSWPAGLLLGGLLLLAYWRGTLAGSELPDHETIQSRFGFGFAVLFVGVVLLVAKQASFDATVTDVLTAVGIAYTLTSMAALALARMEPGSPPAIFSSFVAVALALGGVALLSLAILGLFALDATVRLGQLLGPLGAGAGSILATMLHILLSPVVALAEYLHTHAKASGIHRRALPFTSGRRPALTHAVAIPFWLHVVQYVLIVLCAAAIAFLAWRLFPRPQPRQRSIRSRPRRWSHPARAGFVIALRTWLRRLFSRGETVALDAIAGMRHRVLRRRYPSDPVRHLYARLLHRASSHGLERGLATTPHEFQAHLTARWPEGASEFGTLTEAYILRRYGEMPAAALDLASLSASWRRVRPLMDKAPSDQS